MWRRVSYPTAESVLAISFVLTNLLYFKCLCGSFLVADWWILACLQLTRSTPAVLETAKGGVLETDWGALSAVLDTFQLQCAGKCPGSTLSCTGDWPWRTRSCKKNDQEALKAVGKTVQRALSAVLEPV